MQLALTRALLVLQDASRREITRDWEKRERVFRYYLTTGKEIPENIKTNISRKKHPEIFSKFKISIRKHVQDGICLPTVAISSLPNKVNIRSRSSKKILV